MAWNGGVCLIKKIEDWTFTEHQAHAKGLLEGLFLGFLFTAISAGGLFLIFR
jgi:hypothetical protein